MPGHPAHVGVDGHPVIVQDHDHRLVRGPGVIQSLKTQTTAQGSVTDQCQHLIVLMQQRPGPCHAQGHGHGVGGVAGDEGIVGAFPRLGESGETAERAPVSLLTYHFVTSDEFLSLKDEGGFVETAQVFNFHYGTSWKEVKAKLRHGMDVILVIDWQGAEQVRISHPEAITIFILPPSLETLRARLFARNEDSVAVVENRMRDASNQIMHYKDFDYYSWINIEYNWFWSYIIIFSNNFINC